MTSGRVSTITPDRRGDTLLTATAEVDAVLEVEDTTDFDEDGGWLVIADSAPIAYTGLDDEAGTLTLADPVGEMFEAGMPVDLWDPTVPPTGAKVVEYVATVDVGHGVVPGVTIPHELVPSAGVDNLVAASVAIDEDGDDDWYIAQVFGREPVVDLSTADASTLDVDALPALPGAQTISDVAPTDVDGYPEGHGWWQVDADGKALGFWRLTGGVWTPITVVNEDVLNAGNVLTNALFGNTITGATVQTREEQNRGIKLVAAVDDDGSVIDALYIYDENGVPFIKAVPAEGLAVIAGEIKAVTTTVTDGSSLGGITEITRHPDGSAGAVRLTGYTTAPKSAPTVTTGYDTVQFTDDGNWADRHGWSTDGTYWFTVWSSPYTATYLEKWNGSGGLVLSSDPLSDLARNSVVNGSDFYTLTYNGANWYVNRYQTSDFALTGTATWPHADGSKTPAIGVDATTGDLLIAQPRPSNSDKVRIRRYTWPALDGDPLVAGTFLDTDFNYGNNLAGVSYGVHDLGTNRYIFTSLGSAQYQVVSTATGGSVSAEDWQSGMSAKVGFTYTGGAFVSMDRSGLMRTYTGQDKANTTGSANMTKWVSNDLSTATLHTDQSPRAKITIPKRTKLNVTTSAINTGGANAPDRVRIFVGQGATDPGPTGMWKQTDPAAGVITTAYSSLATSGTNPVTTNGFITAGGTVQGIEEADGTVFHNGLGKGAAWTTYTPTFTAGTTNPNLANFTRSGRYARIGRNTVTFSLVITCTGTGGTGGVGSGSYEIGLPVAARALDEVVVHARQTGPVHSYVGANTASTSSFSMVLAGADTNFNNTNAGMTTGTVVRISGTYEAA